MKHSPVRTRFRSVSSGMPGQTQSAEVTRRSHDTVIRVYDAAGNVIETHDHKVDFKE
jgi:hypothetical protein